MKADLYRQLKFKLEAGESLVAGFRSAGGAFRPLASLIESGASLTEAVKKRGFPPADRLYLGIGEATGRLENALESLVELYDVRHHYESKLWSAFLKSMIVLLVGIVGSYFLFKSVNMELILGMKIWYVIAVMILGIGLVILQVLAPGLRRWIDVSGVAFCVASGLSFEDTKRELKDAGSRIRMKSQYFHKMLSMPLNDEKLVQAGEETGKLDSALDKVRATAAERMEHLLIRLERGFYYSGVVLVMATILASIAVFAVSGLSKAL
jgi:type II secretory pathway component PulF